MSDAPKMPISADPEKDAGNSAEAARAPRTRGRPFKKGQSGNPLGRRKGWGELTKYAQDFSQEAIDGILAVARSAKTSPRDKALAWSMLLDRGMGKPVQGVVSVGEGGGSAGYHKGPGIYLPAESDDDTGGKKHGLDLDRLTDDERIVMGALTRKAFGKPHEGDDKFLAALVAPERPPTWNQIMNARARLSAVFSGLDSTIPADDRARRGDLAELRQIVAVALGVVEHRPVFDERVTGRPAVPLLPPGGR